MPGKERMYQTIQRLKKEAAEKVANKTKKATKKVEVIEENKED